MFGFLGDDSIIMSIECEKRDRAKPWECQHLVVHVGVGPGKEIEKERLETWVEGE